MNGSMKTTASESNPDAVGCAAVAAPSTAPPRGSAASAASASRRRWVTDAPTRMFHVLFALCFAIAWVTGDSERWRLVHVTAGYTMAGLLGFRVVYGFVGPRSVRWSSFVGRLRGAGAWWRAVRASTGVAAIPWRQGQNLLMAAVTAALMLGVVPLALSGYATYQEWGGEWLAELHEAFANLLLMLVLVHIGLIALASALRRQNQALPMFGGRVAGTGPDVVAAQRRWLALSLLSAAVVFGAWQWVEARAGVDTVRSTQAAESGTRWSNGDGGRKRRHAGGSSRGEQARLRPDGDQAGRRGANRDG